MTKRENVLLRIWIVLSVPFCLIMLWLAWQNYAKASDLAEVYGTIPVRCDEARGELGRDFSVERDPRIPSSGAGVPDPSAQCWYRLKTYRTLFADRAATQVDAEIRENAYWQDPSQNIRPPDPSAAAVPFIGLALAGPLAILTISVVASWLVPAMRRPPEDEV